MNPFSHPRKKSKSGIGAELRRETGRFPCFPAFPRISTNHFQSIDNLFHSLSDLTATRPPAPVLRRNMLRRRTGAGGRETIEKHGVVSLTKSKFLSFIHSDTINVTVYDISWIDDVPDYSVDDPEIGYNGTPGDSDNYFLRMNDDHRNLDVNYRILPADLPVTGVYIKIYDDDVAYDFYSNPIKLKTGEKVDNTETCKTGDNLHIIWTPSLEPVNVDTSNAAISRFYRLQLEVFAEGIQRPVCRTPISDAEFYAFHKIADIPGYQCPQKGLVVHDLIWKHRPEVYMGTVEVVGPPQHPFNHLVVPGMRHKNGAEKTNPDSDTSRLPEPYDYNDFGDMSTTTDFETLLGDSAMTYEIDNPATEPYFDLREDVLQTPGAPAYLLYHCPRAENEQVRDKYLFMQYWMYEPASHAPYNISGIFNNSLFHECDWEMCQFTLRLKDPKKPSVKAKWVEPFAATASQHYYGQTLLWDRTENEWALRSEQKYVRHTDSGNRVLIYIAENSHATYFRLGEISTPESVKGCGIQEQYEYLSVAYDYIGPGNSPLNFGLVWLAQSNIYHWADREEGLWGQTIHHWTIGKYGHGQPSPHFRFGLNDKNEHDQVWLAREPVRFHELCRKTEIKDDLELK